MRFIAKVAILEALLRAGLSCDSHAKKLRFLQMLTIYPRKVRFWPKMLHERHTFFKLQKILVKKMLIWAFLEVVCSGTRGTYIKQMYYYIFGYFLDLGQKKSS